MLGNLGDIDIKRIGKIPASFGQPMQSGREEEVADVF